MQLLSNWKVPQHLRWFCVQQLSIWAVPVLHWAQHMLWLPRGAVVIFWLQQLLHCEVQRWAVQERDQLCELPSGALSSHECAHLQQLCELPHKHVVRHWRL